jgi:hypothetical protein
MPKNSRAEGASALPKAGVKAQPERLICHLPVTQIPSPPKKSCQPPPLTAINISPQQPPPPQPLTTFPPPENSWHSSYAQPAIIKVVKLKQKAARRAPTRKPPQPFAFNPPSSIWYIPKRYIPDCNYLYFHRIDGICRGEGVPHPTTRPPRKGGPTHATLFP